MQRWMRITALCALASPALYALAACGASGASTDTEAPDPLLADVIFEGGANGKSLDALLAAPTLVDPTRGAVIDSPTTGTEIPPSPVMTFTWHPGSGMAALQGAPSLLPVDRASRLSLRGPLAELFGPEREARADATLMSGVGYFLLFSTDVTPRLLRVFTTKTSYTPDAKAWAALRSAGTWTTLSVFAASFADDRLAPNGGPWKATPIQFCIAGPQGGGQ